MGEAHLRDILAESYGGGDALCTLRLDGRVGHLDADAAILHDACEIVVDLIDQLIVQGLLYRDGFDDRARRVPHSHRHLGWVDLLNFSLLEDWGLSQKVVFITSHIDYRVACKGCIRHVACVSA